MPFRYRFTFTGKTYDEMIGNIVEFAEKVKPVLKLVKADPQAETYGTSPAAPALEAVAEIKAHGKKRGRRPKVDPAAKAFSPGEDMPAAEVKVEEAKTEAPTHTPAEDLVPAPAAVAEVIITREQLTAKVQELLAKTNIDVVLAIFKKYGTAKLKELKEEHIAKVYAEVEAALN